VSTDLETMLYDAMSSETSDVLLSSDALPRAMRSARRHRAVVAAAAGLGVIAVVVAGAVAVSQPRRPGGPSVRVGNGRSALDLPLTRAVRKDLVAAFAAAQHIHVSDVARIKPGSAHYGFMIRAKTYWAVADFRASATASSQAKVQFQDGPFVFTELPAGGWSAWGLLTDSGGGLCPNEVPAGLATAWQIPESQGCAKGSEAYADYANARFGFTVHVPASFVPTSPPADGDGLVLRSADHHATLTVDGAQNVDGSSPAQLLSSIESSYRNHGVTISTHTVNGRTVTIAGATPAGRAVYERDIVFATNFYGFKWSYPSSQHSKYGPMVTVTIESFYPGAHVG
jgi:hypothetical protein